MIFTSVGIDTMHRFLNAPPIPWVVFVHRTGTNWCTLYAPYATATDARIVGSALHDKFCQEEMVGHVRTRAAKHPRRLTIAPAAKSGSQSDHKRQKTGGQLGLFGEEMS